MRHISQKFSLVLRGERQLVGPLLQLDSGLLKLFSLVLEQLIRVFQFHIQFLLQLKVSQDQSEYCT
ncbi:hypothetical protein D3C87_1737220 [compost metagenome]